MYQKKGGTIAEVTATGDYQDIKASYDYRKQKSSFEDKIYLEYNGELQIKQLKVFEITLELNKVSSAVNKAVYSKSSTNINDAKKLVLAFYDLPIREELLDKLNSINPSSGGNSGGGGGGGGTCPVMGNIAGTVKINAIYRPGVSQLAGGSGVTRDGGGLVILGIGPLPLAPCGVIVETIIPSRAICQPLKCPSSRLPNYHQRKRLRH